MKSLPLLLIGWVSISMPGSCPADHPNHTSFTEVQWNSTTGNLEISLCLWPADLETALTLMRDNPTNLDAVKNIDAILEDYVKKNFAVTGPKKLAHAVRWVGSEIDAKQAWLYFEIDGNLLGDRVTIHNMVLFEVNPGQTNHVQFKSGSVGQYAMATFGQPDMVFEMTGR